MGSTAGWEVAARLGIAHILDKRTYEISGGEQQRVAIARAIVHRPAILLADEPTGNVDSKASRDIMEAFADLNSADGATILVVTHDPFVASLPQDRVHQGRQSLSELRKKDGRQTFFQEVLDTLSVLGGEYGDPAVPEPERDGHERRQHQCPYFSWHTAT